MLDTIKAVFDHHCGNLRVDDALARRIITFDNQFVTKNPDHVNFFGSALLGVYPVRWTDVERNTWIDDIIDFDEIGLRVDLFKLQSIDPKNKVATDLVNLSFIYVLHRLNASDDIKPAMKETAMRSVIAIMHYKFLSSLMAYYFPYPADEALAKTTYNSLSLKFDIKRLGSWGALIRNRAETVTAKNSLHNTTFQFMRDDKSVQYMVTDIQTRIRDVVKSQTQEFYRIKEADGKIINTSKILLTDEGFTVKDTRRTYSQYATYMDRVISDFADLHRKELLAIIMKLNTSADERIVTEGLRFIHQNYREDKKLAYVRKYVEEVLMYSLNFIHEKKYKMNDLGNILLKLRAMFVGSRVNDTAILAIRDMGDRIILGTGTTKPGALVSPERTALTMYIIARALTKNYYTR